MTALTNFDFEDKLVRVLEVEAEPWFVGKDICACLDLKNPRSSLDLLDHDEKGVHTLDTLGGNQQATIVSEPGLYRLIFRSRKAEAERFKRWIAHEVLPSIRKTGSFTNPSRRTVEPEQTPSERRQALEMVREARLLFGPERARELWLKTPELPEIPEAPKPEHLTEPDECLLHLLSYRYGDGRSIEALIKETQHAHLEASGILATLGIRLVDCDDQGEGMAVANSHHGIRQIFKGSIWSSGKHKDALRLLEGTAPWKVTKFAGHSSLATFLPMDLVTAIG
ncbi:Bro-N domain-containing protein [Pseudovibrio sp. POLY-S9]|uniref:BRO-N domain-containing protein n=1 Tax=Pseudovibrio sp. POLY-S9 TaxID=1576596 RepID=UPI0009E7F126|nr:Bro-N domain-containing protein [Pseudovibrio sp. POLY-S9]